MKTTAYLSALLVMVASLALSDDVKYVFVLIGDGYGPIQRRATETLTGETLAMSRMEKTLFTGTDNAAGKTTDSAASGTAIACGVKTYNGVVGRDKQGRPVESIAMKLKEKGVKIGLISSSPLTDATPAAFYAHQAKRSMPREIGMDMAKSGITFIGGAGVQDTNTLTDLRTAGWSVIEGSNVLSQVKPGVQTFVNSAPYTPWNPGDTPTSPTLAEYLSKAIEVLDGPNGFFIMLENGHIDHSGHNNDAGTMWREVLELDAAVKVALEFQAKHPAQTLVLVTADHETGGLQADNLDPAKLQILRRQRAPKNVKNWAPAELMAKSAAAAPPVAEGNRKAALLSSLQDYLGITFDDAERARVGDSIDKALAGKSPKDNMSKAFNDAFVMRDKRAGIRYTTGGHSSTKTITNVQGPGSDRFEDPLENSDIPHLLQAVVLPKLADRAYAKERAARVSKYLALKPYRTLPKATPDVFSVNTIPIDTKTSVIAGQRYEVQLPDWGANSVVQALAGNGTYYLEIKNTSRDLPMLFGIDLKNAPSDAAFHLYDPDNATVFLKEDGSDTWTATEIAGRFRAACLPAAQAYVLCSREPKPEFSKNKLSVARAIANYTKTPKQIPTLEVKTVGDTPVIDGRLDDAAWKGAESHALVALDGTALKNAPTVRSLTDQAHRTLYLALSAPDKDIVCKSTDRDTKQYDDDCFEIFVGDTSSNRYYHIVVNPSGSIYDAEMGDSKWNAQLDVRTTVDKTKGIWTAELALPLDQFHFTTPIVGNICRTGMPGPTRGNLAPTGGDFHSKASFIPFLFGE